MRDQRCDIPGDTRREEEIQRDARTDDLGEMTRNGQLTGQQALVPIKQGLPEEQ